MKVIIKNNNINDKSRACMSSIVMAVGTYQYHVDVPPSECLSFTDGKGITTKGLGDIHRGRHVGDLDALAGSFFFE